MRTAAGKIDKKDVLGWGPPDANRMYGESIERSLFFLVRILQTETLSII